MLLAVAVAMTGPRASAWQVESDMATGIRQVREGEFDAALVTLDGVVRQLSNDKGGSRELARANTYLAIAYIGLGQEEAARVKFLAAWTADKGLNLSPREFPPNIVAMFEDVKREAEARARADEKKAETRTVVDTEAPTSASPGSTTPSTSSETKKGGPSKALFIVGGLAAAGGVAALAAGGGGNTSDPSMPPEPPASGFTPSGGSGGGSMTVASATPTPGSTLSTTQGSISVALNVLSNTSLRDVWFFAALLDQSGRRCIPVEDYALRLVSLTAGQSQTVVVNFPVSRSECPPPYTIGGMEAGPVSPDNPSYIWNQNFSGGAYRITP
jgi:hypothetical protein